MDWNATEGIRIAAHDRWHDCAVTYELRYSSCSALMAISCRGLLARINHNFLASYSLMFFPAGKQRYCQSIDHRGETWHYSPRVLTIVRDRKETPPLSHLYLVRFSKSWSVNWATSLQRTAFACIDQILWRPYSWLRTPSGDTGRSWVRWTSS